MADKVCSDNIYDTFIYFDKMNAVMEEADRREFLTHLIEMVEIYEEEQPNGQWLKSITFKLLSFHMIWKLVWTMVHKSKPFACYRVKPQFKWVLGLFEKYVPVFLWNTDVLGESLCIRG